MNGICIGGCFFLSGFYMKLCDDEWDEKGRKVETVFITESKFIILQNIGVSVG